MAWKHVKHRKLSASARKKISAKLRGKKHPHKGSHAKRHSHRPRKPRKVAKRHISAKADAARRGRKHAHAGHGKARARVRVRKPRVRHVTVTVKHARRAATHTARVKHATGRVRHAATRHVTARTRPARHSTRPRRASSGHRATHRHGHRRVVHAGLRTPRNRFEHHAKPAPRAHRNKVHIHAKRLKVTRIIHKKRR